MFVELPEIKKLPKDSTPSSRKQVIINTKHIVAISLDPSGKTYTIELIGEMPVVVTTREMSYLRGYFKVKLLDIYEEES